MWSFLFLLLLYVKVGVTFNEHDIPELAYLDTSLNPCDDFHKFACANFGKYHPRPAHTNIMDHFTLLENQLVQIGHEIVSYPILEKDPMALKKAKTAYKGCIDQTYLLTGLVPELATIHEFGGLPLVSSTPNETVTFSWADLANLVAEYGVPMIFVHSIAQPKINDSMIVLSKDNLSNPKLLRPRSGRSYEELLEEDFHHHARRRSVSSPPKAFDVFLQTVARHLLQVTNSSKQEQDVLKDLNAMATFMRKMYAGGIQDDNILPLKDSLITVGQLQDWTDRQFNGQVQLNWTDYFNTIFKLAGIQVTSQTKITNLAGIKYIYGVLNLVRLTDPKIVKNYALLRVILFQAPDSDEVIRTAFQAYYDAKGYKSYHRWEYCTRKLLDVVDLPSLSFAVTYGYKQDYYNVSKIPQALRVVQDLQRAMVETITTADWMDEESRNAALKKVDNMLVLLGYPDLVDETLDEFYDKLRVYEWDNYGNARRIRAFRQAYQYSLLASRDRKFWDASTFDPNAYYNRPNNRIVVPISILNPLFFYGDSPILDYSRLGFLVGHEFTHAFDYGGLGYNWDGNNVHLWSNTTNMVYSDRTGCLKKQYSQYFVEEIQIYVKGSNCINENIADNGGLRTSFKAFMNLVNAGEVPVTGNYTAEQLFFIGYATMWCSEEDPNYLENLVNNSNSYAPKRFRTIGTLSNMAEFASAFNCPVGSGMNGGNRCEVW